MENENSEVLTVLRNELEIPLETENLALEHCPEPVQVMPPAYVIPFALKVLGNMIVGILLLGGLFAAPAWLFSMITNF